ncbi:MAG: SpaA isopeptide-forming pilin-related protein, partial [Marmoricola sp.]
WTANTSAGASSKGDMGNIYFWSHVAADNHIWAYVGIERLSTSGTVDYFVELNQKGNVPSADHTISVPNRSVNDIRLQVTDHGASNWQVTATGDRWSGSAWVQDQALSNDFYGLVDDNTITSPAQFNSPVAALNTPKGTLVANQFTEFAVDLTAAGYVPDVCGTTVFGQLNVRSVSSLSPQSESKDFAQGQIKTPNPCAQITVTKQDENGTTINNNPATFKFEPDPTLSPSDPNYATSSLTVTDGGAGDADGTVNGVVTLNNVQIGATNIKVTEITPPSGYFVDTPAFQTIAGPTVGGTNYPLTFKDPLGSISWQKWDSATGAPVTVAGATFTVTATGGPAAAAPWSTVSTPFSRTVTDNGTNDDNGTAGQLTLSGLPAGTYSITETGAPPGYLLPQPPNDTITGVSVDSTTTVDAGHFTDGYGSMKWQKEDPNGVDLAGATFQVTYPDGSVYNVADNTGSGPACVPAAPSGSTPGTACDSDATGGVFQLDGLKTGTYSIVETVAPSGYTLATNTLTGVITDKSWTTVDAGAVQDGQGSIQWNKVGPDGKTPLGGATFRLDGPNGFTELVTDDGNNDTDSTAGSIKVTGLAPGDYTITEVTPPPGYLLPTTNNPALSATVPSSGTTTVQAGTITDPLGAIAWHKVGPDGQTPLGGATFAVTFPDGSVYTVVDNTGSTPCTAAAPSGSTPGVACDTDTSAGNLELDGVPAGDYTITETIPPTGYLLPASGNPLTKTIGIGDNTGPVNAGTLTDPLGAITWTKVGPAGLTPIGGATFQVTYPDGSVYNVADNTGSGPACVPAAPSGSTPGVACDTNAAGGVFELDSLMTGAYTVTETAPPPGYLMPTSGNPLSATITTTSNNGPVNAGTLSDPLGSLTWHKVTPNGDGSTLLGGATFAVIFPDGSVYTVVDNTGTGTCAPQAPDGTTPGIACDVDPAAGVLQLDGLMTGDYTVTETIPPPGYLLPLTGNPLHATIGVNDNGGPVFAGTLSDPLGAITWTKFGPDGRTPLGGATFLVTGPNGFSETVVDNGSNDANPAAGVFEIDGLKTGTYTITETVPPPGYLLPATGNPLHATITVNDNDGAVSAGGLTDKFGSIAWRKLNKATGGLIPRAGTKFTLVATAGAGLTVFHFSKTVVDNGSNDADSRIGYIKVVNVPTGTYTITETAPPSGFVQPSTGRSITGVVVKVTSTTTVNAGAISDPPSLPVIRPGHPTLPDTGGPDLRWLILGGGLLAGGIALMFTSKYRRNRKA